MLHNYKVKKKNSSAMGCATSLEDANFSAESQGKDNLNIATLNYSSDSMNPFEFYSLDHYLEEYQFDSKVKDIISNDKTLNLTIIKIFDSHIKPRYSPLYTPSFGIKEYRFEDKERFKKTWMGDFLAGANDQKFTEVIQDLMKEKEEVTNLSYKQLEGMKQGLTDAEWEKIDITPMNEKSEKEKNICSIISLVRRFDYIVFECILRYVYGTNSVDHIFKNRGVAKYIGFMQRFFGKPFLNEGMKENRIINFITQKNIDVLFLQNVTTSFCQNFTMKMPNYRLKRGTANCLLKPDKKEKKEQLFCNSAIIIKQSSFRKAYLGKKGNLIFRDIMQDVAISNEIKQRFLKWKGTETAIESIGNFILISFDAKNKGKSEDVKKDFQEFIDHLKVLKERFPKKYIVIGGIFDSFLSADNNDNLKKINLQKYPNVLNPWNRQYMTCHNKRTYLMSFSEEYIKNDKKEEEKINKPMCRNFLIFPIRMNKPAKEVSVPLDLVNTQQKKIERGIYSAGDEIDLQGEIGDLGYEFECYLQNEEMHINKDQLGYLPNRKHPFNQYFVAINLRVPQRKPGKHPNQVVEEELDYDQKRPFQSSSSESEQSEFELDNHQIIGQND